MLRHSEVAVVAGERRLIFDRIRIFETEFLSIVDNTGFLLEHCLR
jgi:hypothetical protein